MGKLSEKVAVITGGSSGIGLATALRFVEEGAYVFITGRRPAELARAKARIGRNVSTVQGDIADLGDLDRLYAVVQAEKGCIDVLVANAGYVELATLSQATPEHFDRTFDVNARGTFFTVQKALPLLNPGASIVLVSSAGHLKGIPMYTTYAATKAAMRSFVRSWAAELKDRGIRVNMLSPGSVNTPIIDAQVKTKEEGEAMLAQMVRIIPLGRVAEADEMARAVLFLASSDSSYSTGSELVADGGLSQL